VGETSDWKREFSTETTSINVSNSPTELKIEPKVPDRDRGDRNQLCYIFVDMQDIEEKIHDQDIQGQSGETDNVEFY
jgi:hypothetical protein